MYEEIEVAIVEDDVIRLKSLLATMDSSFSEQVFAKAAKYGSTKCLQMLLSYKDMNIDIVCSLSGFTATMLAANNNEIKCLKLLLVHGADVNAHSSGVRNYHTALTLASLRGHTECVELLLSYGADINDHSGLYPEYTALTWAVFFNAIECVELLLAHGAEVIQTAGRGLCKLDRAGQDLLIVAKAIKDTIKASLEAACTEGLITPGLKSAVESIVNKIVFSSGKSLEELASQESEDFINASIKQATTGITEIEKYDTPTRNFILDNISFYKSSLESDFKHWNLQELGPKKTLVHLLVLCGAQVEGIGRLLGHPLGDIKYFMHAIPVNDDGTICKYSVGEFALRVISKNPMEKFSVGESVAKHIASFLGFGDVVLSLNDVGLAEELDLDVDDLNLLADNGPADADADEAYITGDSSPADA